MFNFYGFKGSFILHLGLFFAFLIKPLVLPSEQIISVPSIRVDMVDLPDKIVEPLKIEKPENKPKEKPKKLKPKKKKVDKAKEVKTQKIVPNKLGKSAIQKIKQMQALKSDSKDNAETVVKGNRLSKGTQLEGEEKKEYDFYIDLLGAHARRFWLVPGWLENEDLTTEVRVFLDEDGYVTEQFVEKSSGNSSFDQSVKESIENASPFPRPVEKFVGLVKLRGIIFTLSP